MSKIEIIGNYDSLLKKYICKFSQRNMIAYFSKSEKNIINTIKECVTEENLGYLDVPLDFSDYDRLQPMISNLPDDKYRMYEKHFIARQYLLYQIMKSAKLDKEYSLVDFEKNLFSDDVYKLHDAHTPFDFEDISEELNHKAQDTSTIGAARIHFFLDEVNDIPLQLCINDIYATRWNIGMMGYTTKDRLLLATTTGNGIQDINDFMSYTSDKREEEKKKLREY